MWIEGNEQQTRHTAFGCREEEVLSADGIQEERAAADGTAWASEVLRSSSLTEAGHVPQQHCL